MDRIKSLVNFANFSRIAFVVEGKRDELALKKLGFSNVLSISGKSCEKVVKEILEKDFKEVTLATDFDEEGERLRSKLRFLLQKHKVKINSFYLNFLKSFKIVKVEELNSLIKEIFQARCK